MVNYFTPPVNEATVSPTLPYGPEIPNKLFRHYRARPEGINVFIYSDDSVSTVEPDGYSTLWRESDRTTDTLANAPHVTHAFWGGHEAEEVTEEERILLEGAGYTVDSGTGNPGVLADIDESFTLADQTLTTSFTADQNWTLLSDSAAIYSNSFTSDFDTDPSSSIAIDIGAYGNIDLELVLATVSLGSTSGDSTFIGASIAADTNMFTFSFGAGAWWDFYFEGDYDTNTWTLYISHVRNSPSTHITTVATVGWPHTVSDGDTIRIQLVNSFSTDIVMAFSVNDQAVIALSYTELVEAGFTDDFLLNDLPSGNFTNIYLSSPSQNATRIDSFSQRVTF